MKRLAWILICLPLLSLACGEEDKDTSDTGAPEGDTDTDTDADTDPDPHANGGEYATS